ncbi:MAG: restriction endonuclease subunit S, partial [Planctomycetes bacterium]|nr:restriction endonuclease subunit S [Planctomycetota bacterium]
VLPKDSVLVVCIGSTIGKAGLTFEDKSATNQQINAIICKEEFNPHFIYYLLDYKSDYIRSLATPSPVPIISKGKFQQAVIPITKNRKDQLEIAKILSALDEKTEKTRHRKEILQVLFKSMLHHLMTGQIRVKDVRFS